MKRLSTFLVSSLSAFSLAPFCATAVATSAINHWIVARFSAISSTVVSGLIIRIDVRIWHAPKAASASKISSLTLLVRRPGYHWAGSGAVLTCAALMLDGARTQAQFGAGQTKRSTILAGLLNIVDQLLALQQRNHASSPAIQSAFYFRDNNSSAAVSANASSLQCKSLSSCRMRFLSVTHSVTLARFYPADKAMWTLLRQLSSFPAVPINNPLLRQFRQFRLVQRGRFLHHRDLVGGTYYLRLHIRSFPLEVPYGLF